MTTRLSIFSIAILGALAGCYGPKPADGAFRCSAESGYACPEGQRCDLATSLCVAAVATPDLSTVGDGGAPSSVTATCDERVRAGALTNPRLLSNVSSTFDDRSLALSAAGDRIYFVSTRSGTAALYTAAIDPASPAAVAAASLVTLSDPTLVPNGGTFGADGAYWFAGTGAGVTQLYRSTASPATMLTISDTRLPSATGCAFSDPVFAEGDPTFQLFVAFPLAACNKSSTIAVGRAGRNIGAFYGALVGEPGFAAPSLLPGALTLIASSESAARRLHYAVRPSTDTQFSSAAPIPRATFSPEDASDRQLVVRADCSVAYLVSSRSGGLGGDDLWIVDITP